MGNWVAVITGDIINSRLIDNQDVWLSPLKKIFKEFGKSGKKWELYRGDSYQLEIPQPEEALLTAIRIKATIRCIKGIDVRQAIGIGEKNFESSKMAESNGEAFIYSGEQFDSLIKDKQTLAIRTANNAINQELNLMLRLGLIAMDSWTVGAAEVVKYSIENPDLNQNGLADLLGIAQSSVSERQRRAHLSEIMELESFYRDMMKRELEAHVTNRQTLPSPLGG